MTGAPFGPPWADPALGEVPGLGNDRPRGGPDLKPELEAGLAVVRFAYDSSRVDRPWSTLEERGYAWWAHDLRQRIWAEPPFDDDGIEIHRVFARTDLARGVTVGAATGRAIDAINAMSAGSALILDEQTGTLSSVASMWVHEQTRDWVARTFAGIAAIQVAQAQAFASLVAGMVGGEPARSEHPTAGPRTEPDEMLGLLDVVKAVGRGPSSWAGDGLLEALRQVRAIPMVGLASGDASGIALQLPYRQTEALIQLGTREAHPALGHGLLVRTSLPGDAGPGPDWALMRNRQEMTSLTRAHLVGSWVGSASFATFVAFYPNLLAPAGMTPVNIALSEMHRVRWLAEIGRSGSQG